MADSSLRVPLVAGAEASLATDLQSGIHTIELSDVSVDGLSESSLRVPLVAGAEAKLATYVSGSTHILKVGL